MSVITIDNIVVERGKKTVLNDVSFSVNEGEVFALLGGNGAGKSSTLLTLLGFTTISAGSAQVLGHNVTKEVDVVRNKVTYLPEAVTLYPHLSAYENLEYFLSLGKRSANKKQMDETLDRVSLDPAARQTTMATYSKGMRQKVAIALAILRNTPVLMADEPTSGLDPVAIDDFNKLVTELAGSGITVLMVTHDVYGACQVADRVGLLHRGEIVGLFDAEGKDKIDTEVVHAAFADRASQ